MGNTEEQNQAFHTITASVINGIHTDFVFHKFANKYFIIVTQYEKISNIFVASNDIALTGVISRQSLSVQHKFGKTSDEIECALQFLLTNLKLNLDVVISLTLKEYNRSVLYEIKKILENIK